MGRISQEVGAPAIVGTQDRFQVYWSDIMPGTGHALRCKEQGVNLINLMAVRDSDMTVKDEALVNSILGAVGPTTRSPLQETSRYRRRGTGVGQEWLNRPAVCN